MTFVAFRISSVICYYARNNSAPLSPGNFSDIPVRRVIRPLNRRRNFTSIYVSRVQTACTSFDFIQTADYFLYWYLYCPLTLREEHGYAIVQFITAKSRVSFAWICDGQIKLGQVCHRELPFHRNFLSYLLILTSLVLLFICHSSDGHGTSYMPQVHRDVVSINLRREGIADRKINLVY